MKMPYDFSEIDGVVFDFGGVISASPMGNWSLFPLCESVGIGRDAVMNGWHRYRILWDGGVIDFREMWSRIFTDNGKTVSDEMIDRLWQADACQWIGVLRKDTLLLMKELKKAGKKIGLLTNMASEFYEKLYLQRAGEYHALTDVEVVSGIVGMAKPLRGIYDYTQRQMGVEAERLMFFDDTLINVEMARKCSWRSELYPSSLDF